MGYWSYIEAFRAWVDELASSSGCAQWEWAVFAHKFRVGDDSHEFIPMWYPLLNTVYRVTGIWYTRSTTSVQCISKTNK